MEQHQHYSPLRTAEQRRLTILKGAVGPRRVIDGGVGRVGGGVVEGRQCVCCGGRGPSAVTERHLICLTEPFVVRFLLFKKRSHTLKEYDVGPDTAAKLSEGTLGP